MKTAEDIVNDKQREIVCISWDQTVHQTCQKMIENKIGAIVVKKDNEFVSWDYCENWQLGKSKKR